MYRTVCPLRGPGSIPGQGGCILIDFSLINHTLPIRPDPVWQKMAQSSMAPHNL